MGTVNVGFARYTNDIQPEGPYEHELVLDTFQINEQELLAKNQNGDAYYHFFQSKASERNVKMRFWSTGDVSKNEPKYLIFVK